jgi:hypothetical protein
VCRTSRVHLTGRRAFFQQFLLSLLLLKLDSILALKPTLGRFVDIGFLVFLKRRQKGRKTRNECGLAFCRGVIGWRNPSQGRARRKEREKIWWKLVRHLFDPMNEVLKESDAAQGAVIDGDEVEATSTVTGAKEFRRVASQAKFIRSHVQGLSELRKFGDANKQGNKVTV